MIRSLWKPPFSEVTIFQKIFLNNGKKQIAIVIFKNSIIFPSYVGNVFLFYDGKKFINLQVLEHMIGYKFTSFIINEKK